MNIFVNISHQDHRNDLRVGYHGHPTKKTPSQTSVIKATMDLDASQRVSDPQDWNEQRSYWREKNLTFYFKITLQYVNGKK